MNKFVLFVELAAIVFAISDLLLVPVQGEMPLITSNMANDNQLNTDAKRMLRVNNGAIDAIDEERMLGKRKFEPTDMLEGIESLKRQKDMPVISPATVNLVNEFFSKNLNHQVTPEEFKVKLLQLRNVYDAKEYEGLVKLYEHLYNIPKRIE